MNKGRSNTTKPNIPKGAKGPTTGGMNPKYKAGANSNPSEGREDLVGMVQSHKNNDVKDTPRESFTLGAKNTKTNGGSNSSTVDNGNNANGITSFSSTLRSFFYGSDRMDASKANGKKGLTQQNDMEYKKPSHDLAHNNNEGRAGVKKASPYAREFDFTDIAYTPHTLSTLVALVASFLFVIRYYYYPHMSVVSSVKLGLVASAMSFVTFGAMHLPDSLMMRPHPSVWRAVLAVALLYLALLSFLLFQDLDTLRAILGIYDPSLLKPLPDIEYASNCGIFTLEQPYLIDYKVLDIYVFAHFFGYFFKTLILRDWRIATCVSIGFEVIEVALQHVMLNLRECWWDHIVLDILLCNAGGTLLGVFTLRFLQAKEYHWVELRHIQGYHNKVQRILGQLGPRSFVRFEWGVFHSPKRFLQILSLITLIFVQETNCFTMKHILRIPHKHHLVIVRLIIWGALSMPAIREVYEYISSAKTKRIGTTAWVGLLILLLETIFIIKMAVEGNYFRETTPDYILIPLLVALVFFVLWFASYFGLLSLKNRLQRRGFMYALSNVFFYSCVACILGLFLMGLPDLQIGRAAFQSFITPYEKYILWWRE